MTLSEQFHCYAEIPFQHRFPAAGSARLTVTMVKLGPTICREVFIQAARPSNMGIVYVKLDSST